MGKGLMLMIKYELWNLISVNVRVQIHALIVEFYSSVSYIELYKSRDVMGGDQGQHVEFGATVQWTEIGTRSRSDFWLQRWCPWMWLVVWPNEWGMQWEVIRRQLTFRLDHLGNHQLAEWPFFESRFTLGMMHIYPYILGFESQLEKHLCKIQGGLRHYATGLLRLCQTNLVVCY